MFHYTSEQLASIIALPLVTIVLIWTVAIFHKNKDLWGPYDIPILALFILSVIRNMTALTYTLFITLSRNAAFDLNYCSILIWMFNSIHTYQASCLTTLAVIGLFSIRLSKKRQSIRQFLTGTHLIYHLFCLMTLCACVGVAAILAQDGNAAIFDTLTVFNANPCKFMPFDLDIKYTIFIIVLHVFLASVSMVAFGAICMTYVKADDDFGYVKKADSDMSLDKNDNYDSCYARRTNHGLDYGAGHAPVWNSDLSNVSTTVSSTNSRRPCLTRPIRIEERTGLETIHPVLIVCYLFYHLPIIVLCIYPSLIKPWPVSGAALWLGLIQDILMPIGLIIVDSRFCKWVGRVYKCSSSHGDDKLPHVGLDGKFRPFGSQPQSLEPLPHHRHLHPNQYGGNNNRGHLQTIEHRFPITNGSLYTSIDGRLPVIHNYRRHHANHKMGVAKTDVTSQLHVQSQLLQLQHSYASDTLSMTSSPVIDTANHVIKSSRNLLRLNRMRLSKSEDSLANRSSCSSSDDNDDVDEDAMTAQFDSISSKSTFSITTEANCDFEFYQSRGKENEAQLQLQKNASGDLRYEQKLPTNSPKQKSQEKNSDLLYYERPQLHNCKLHNEPQLRKCFPSDTKQAPPEGKREPVKDKLKSTQLQNYKLHCYDSQHDGFYNNDLQQQHYHNSSSHKLDKLSPQLQMHKSCSDLSDYNPQLQNNNNLSSKLQNGNCMPQLHNTKYDLQLQNGIMSAQLQNGKKSSHQHDFQLQPQNNNRQLHSKFNNSQRQDQNYNVQLQNASQLQNGHLELHNDRYRSQLHNKSYSQLQLQNTKSQLQSSNSQLQLQNHLSAQLLDDLCRNVPCGRVAQLQRSNSYTTLEERRRSSNLGGCGRRKNCKNKLLRSDSKLSDCTPNLRQRIKSVEYLPSSNASTVFIEDVCYFNYPSKSGGGGISEVRSCVGSVPDLKKVFISEYI